jgi:hypothetical protein
MKTIQILLLIKLATTKLLFISELFRHGARGPLSKYYDYKD